MTTAANDLSLRLPDAPAIEGLRFRRPRGDQADYEAMAAVVAAANTRDDIPWLPTAKHLEEELEGTGGLDQREDVVLAAIGDQVVAEAGVERVVRDGVAVFELWGHIRPEARRRGLGRALLRENLRRAAERAALEPRGQAYEARSHPQESEIGHRTLLEAHGFEPIRWFFDMRRPTLDDVPDAPLPPGLEFRPMTADQHRVVFDAEAEAFRDHWSSREPTEEDFAVLYGRDELDTGLWVVAWDDDEIAGVVQTWIWADENAQLGVARGWLEHISVRRPWRRKGVGRAMTAEALRRLAAAGMTEAMLGVDADSPTGALRLYEGLGFQIHQRSAAYRRAL